MCSLVLAALVLPGSQPALAGAHEWTTHDQFGAPVRDVSASATDPNIVFAVTYGAVERTSDGGRHWHQLLIGTDFSQVAVAPSDPQVIYVANPQILRSGDGGDTWTRVSKGAGSVRTITVDPADANTVYVGNNHGGGVHVTTDGGLTWHRRHRGLPNGSYDIVTAVAVDPSAPGTLYAGTTSHGIFKTTNYGMSWKPLAEPGGLVQVFSIAVDPADPQVILAGMADTLYRTADGGKTWTAVLSRIVFGVVFDPVDPDRVYASSPIAHRSNDGGATWSDYAAGLPPGDAARAITIDGSGLHLHLATDAGVWDRLAT